MLAKILSNGCVYHSPVFAVSMKYPSKAVVFDSSFSELIVVDVCRDNKYTVLFIDFDTDDFSINNSEFKSYWNDKNIFRTIKRKQYTPKMLDEAKEMLRAESLCEFKKIEKTSDFDALDLNSGSFHDGYVLGINEENNTLEILLDTSWGAFIVLKCKGIVKNSLELGQIFSHCDMRIADGFVEFSFAPMSGAEEKILMARHVEFKSIFERKIDIKKFEYSVSENNLTIKTNSGWIEINNSINDILDFKQRNVLGYIENDDVMQRCLIFSNDIVYSFCKYVNSRKRQNKLADKVLLFQNRCKEYGLHFDQYPLYDDFDEYEHDYGKLIYKHKYSTIHQWRLMIQILIPILLFNNGIWVIIQLLNPQMKWTMYLVMGIGASLCVSLLVLISSLIGYTRDKKSGYSDSKCIEIYENGLKHNGYNISFNFDYQNILAVEYKKRIIIQTTWSKFKLYKFKDDKVAYEIIKNQLNKSKNNNF